MNPVPRLLLQILATAPVFAAQGGTLYRCDDGGVAPIYQTLPCSGGQRLVEQRAYPSEPTVEAPQVEARQARPRREAAPVRSARRGRDEPRPAAFLCADRGREWVQSSPCRAAPARPDARRAPPAAPRQTSISREELCRRVRDERDRGAQHERAADATYRRNLMRDRGNC